MKHTARVRHHDIMHCTCPCRKVVLNLDAVQGLLIGESVAVNKRSCSQSNRNLSGAVRRVTGE
jgi:hypothetical protein